MTDKNPLSEHRKLKMENKVLQDKNNRLKQRNKELEAQIELQRAEIIVLQKRNNKAQELKKVFDMPNRRKNVKRVEIDNRNQQ